MAKGEKILHSDIIEKGNPFETAYEGLVKLIAKMQEFQGLMKNNPMTSGKNYKQFTQDTQAFNDVLKQVQKQESAVLTTQAKMAAASHESAKALEIEKNILSQKNRENKLNAEITNSAAGSYNRLSAEYRKNLDQLKKMQVTNQQELKARNELSKVVKRQSDELKKLDKEIGNHQREVGNYKIAVQGLTSQFGLLGRASQLAGDGLNIVKGSFSSFANILKTSGILLIVGAIGSMVNYFREAGNNVLLFNSNLQKLKATWNTFKETSEGIGAGLFDIFSGGQVGLVTGGAKIMQTIKGVGDEYSKQLEVQKALAPLINKYNKLHIENLTKIADLESKRAEAERIATEADKYSIAQRLEAQTAAKDLTTQIYDLQKAEQQLKVSIANQNNILDKNIESDQKLEEEKAALIMLNAKEDQDLKALNRRYNTLTSQLKDQKTEYEKLKAAKLEFLTPEVEGKPIEDFSQSNKVLEAERQARQEKKTEEEEFLTWLQAERDKSLEAELQRIEKQKQAEKELKEQRIYAAQETANFIGEIGNMMYSMQQANLNQEMQDAEELRDYKVRMAGDDVKKRTAAENEYQTKAKEIKKKEAKNTKNQAIFNASINLAQAIARAFGDFPFPAGVVFAALAAVLAGAQLAAIIAQPLPSFRKGTKSLKADGTGSDKDGILIQAHEGERIIPKKENQLIGDIENNQIPGLVYMGKKYNSEFPILAEIAEKQLREQRNTNGLLKKFKYVDKQGRVITMEGNVVSYV